MKKAAATMIVVPGTGSGKWDWKGMPSSSVGGIGSIEKGKEGVGYLSARVV